MEIRAILRQKNCNFATKYTMTVLVTLWCSGSEGSHVSNRIEVTEGGMIASNKGKKTYWKCWYFLHLFRCLYINWNVNIFSASFNALLARMGANSSKHCLSRKVGMGSSPQNLLDMEFTIFLRSSVDTELKLSKLHPVSTPCDRNSCFTPGGVSSLIELY